MATTPEKRSTMNSAMTDDKDMYSPTITATPSMEYVAMPPPILGLPDEKTILRELDDNDEEEYPEGGRGWLVVAGCFIQAMATIGLPLAWGVFQEYYKEHVFPDASEATLSFLGSFNGLVMPITSFVAGKLEDRYGYRRFVILGSVLSFLTWFCAAWCTELWHFFLTQGVLQGLANGILFPTICAYPAQWFKRRRALAIGITIAGSSVGGGTSAIIFRVMLSKFGLHKSLLIYSGINAGLLLVAFFLIKDRPNIKASTLAKRREPIVWVDTSLFKSLIFWSMSLCLAITIFGYQTPYIYSSVYTLDKNPNLSPFLGTVPLLVLNLSAALGRTIVGHIADRLGPINIFMLSVLLSGLSQVLIWNFAESYAAIMVFSIVYGFWGGVVISLMSPVGGILFGTEKLANLTGLLVLSNLPGFVAGPTLGGVVLGSSNRWHGVATYSGGVQLVGLAVFCYARFKTNPKFFVKL